MAIKAAKTSIVTNSYHLSDVRIQGFDDIDCHAFLCARHHAGSLEEKSDIISAVSRCLPGTELMGDMFNSGLQWLRENVNAAVSSPVKFHVVDLLTRIAQVSQSNDPEELGEPWALLFSLFSLFPQRIR
jgi:hypothetical protein